MGSRAWEFCQFLGQWQCLLPVASSSVALTVGLDQESWVGGKPSSAGGWGSALKGLTPSICSYIITVLRLTTMTAWRSSGTCVVFLDLSCSFLISADRQWPQSWGNIAWKHTSANPKVSAGYRETNTSGVFLGQHVVQFRLFRHAQMTRIRLFMWINIRRHRGKTLWRG